MVSKVEIQSKEMIKPSSPTPHNLRNLKLSFLDQIPTPNYIPLIFFYQQLPTKANQSLKDSLSNVLTQFYPLAGRLSPENYITVDCNDSGALFVEAKIHNANLSSIVKDPRMDELEKCLPLGPTGTRSTMAEANTLLLAVQINHFDCGGIAVAVQMSHKIADGNSMVNFMNAWAAASRGDDDHDREKFSPTFDMANFFPPKDMSGFAIKPTTATVPKQEMVTKRLLFDKGTLAKLKSAESTVQVKNPTRVEAVTTFLWRHFIHAPIAKGSKKAAAVFHAVNLRPRMDPPIPSQAFGNGWANALAIPVVADEGCLVGELRGAIRKINGDYVKEIQSGGEGYLKDFKRNFALQLKGEIECSFFSSWCRFPVYEVDYGWGRPIWVSTTTFPYKNLVILMSTSCGEGIEAWVNMLQEDASLDFSI